MKKLAFVFIATIMLGALSCTKTKVDPPVPTPDYTINYSVVSTGEVMYDTIKYLDKDGLYKYEFNKSQFELSFTQPSTNYHGYMYISGEITNGSTTYSLTVKNLDGGVIKYNGHEGSSTAPFNFNWSAEVSSSEN